LAAWFDDMNKFFTSAETNDGQTERLTDNASIPYGKIANMYIISMVGYKTISFVLGYEKFSVTFFE